VKHKKVIGITGASGSLGKALTKKFKDNGYYVIGFTHSKVENKSDLSGPNEWIYWECGKEYLLKENLKKIDILILNHGIYKENIQNLDFEKSLDVNAISKLKIFNIFKENVMQIKDESPSKEIWINTSEAEILPALSPAYEISKSLIGKLITYQYNFLSKNERQKLKIRKIIIGPFKSKLNPIGIMDANIVALLIYFISKLRLNLIIITPNPITYLIFPLKEIYYFLYYSFLKFLKHN
tara:strand:- start:1770 stop:2483 length:714 start_codon:yes stop_codon:yes gene_type:complete